MAKRRERMAWFLPVVFLASFATGVSDLRPEGDCSSWIGPTRVVNGKTIGPKSCTIFEERAILNASGVPFRRIEVGISGTIEGYTAKTGPEPYPELMQFVDFPEFTLAQKGNLGPYYHGTSSYTGVKDKSGMTIFVPESAEHWNGKLFMVFHGGSPYPPIGEILSRKADQYNPLMGHNNYAGLMMDRGYAVVYTRRSAYKGRGGDRQAVLDGGTVLEGKEHQYHVGLLRDWTQMAKNMLQARFGRKPTRTYWYGRSGGAAPGRLFNYVPGANRDANGQKLFDGFLLDDSAGGWFWPTLYFTKTEIKDGMFSVKRDDRDHLVYDDAFKEAFAPQIDILHQAYVGDIFVIGNYQWVKRENARHLMEKGLGAKSRTYEIVGVSHGDAGAVYPSELWKQNLDLGGVFDPLIDALDRWVERGVAPSPTRSDAPFLGDADRDGVLENPAIELPEVACPTGVYYEFPPSVHRPGRTGFAAYLKEERPAINADTTPLPSSFQESWLEPLDSRGRPVDMNGNKVRDTRESITQAWQRRAREGEKYGVLGPHEKLARSRYVSCVSRVASELFEQNLLSEKAKLHYISEAENSDIGKHP